MENYGLNSFQRERALKKLRNNINFMHDNGIELDNKIVPYADFVQNSYMNTDRYIAEIQHRAWNMFDYARENDLKNIMFTLTLPTEWHSKKTFKGKLINNPKFGGRKYITKINGYKFINCHVKQNIPFLEPILDFSQTIDKYVPRNASKKLSNMLKKFFKDRSYTSIDKSERCYFRVTEPHKDGTPHIHMSLFIPKDKQERVIKALNRLYSAPLGQVETDIRKPVHYLMKYVLKTFDDLRDDKNISNLTLWYLYHGISRFYTSRTFINLTVYRKLKGTYSLKDLSQAYRNEEINVYYYKDSDKIALIENEFGTLYTPKPVNWSSKMIEQEFTYLEAEFEPVYHEKEKKKVPVTIDGQLYSYYEGRYTKVTKKPHDMSYLELFQYFKGLDIDTVDLLHYMVVRNLLIDKKVLDDEKLPIDFHQSYMGEWLEPDYEEFEEVF